MAHVSDLLASENLGRLIAAKRNIDNAALLYDTVFHEEGSPNEAETEQEAFYDAVCIIDKRLERLMGAVVFHELFDDDKICRDTVDIL